MAFRDFVKSPGFGERVQRWADALLFGPIGQAGPRPFGVSFGIHGVGILRRHDQDYVVLLTPLRPGSRERQLDEAELIDPESDEAVFAAIKTVLPDEPRDMVRVLRVPPIIPNATAGTAIYAGVQGTAGPRVTWASGRTGFLTAGHVPAGMANVTDAFGAHIGKVIHEFYPGTSSGSGFPNVDVALIEVGSGATLNSFSSGYPIAATAPIDLHLGTGLTTSIVLAMINWYFWPSVGGTYIDLYMTNAACTVGGDSGAAVTTPGTNDAIGMVVGGTATFTSFIQDIHSQIAALRTVTGLGGLAL